MPDPITKVQDTDGNVLHDCVEAGCETSWNGQPIEPAEPETKPPVELISVEDGLATVEVPEE